MAITRKELMKIIRVRTDVEKISNISFDGKNLLIRIPKEIREVLEIKKGDKIRWIVGKDGKLKVDMVG